MQIIPTTGLKQSFKDAEERIELVKDTCRWIQVDVSDNVFTQGKTFELELLRKADFNTDSILWDIHLMVKEPLSWVGKCLHVGASRIIGQVEMMSNREAFVKKIKDEGLEAGLAFDIGTEIMEIPEETDVVLVMGRKAGFGQMDFEDKVYEKIDKLKEIRQSRESQFLIAVDGGAEMENIKKLEEAGVDLVYSEVNYFELKNNGENE